MWLWFFVIQYCYDCYSIKGAQKCKRFRFIHILSHRFNPIRSQLKTVLDFWLVNVCMKECELIKGGHSFRILVEKIIIIIIIIISIILIIITEQQQDRITSCNSGYLYRPFPISTSAPPLPSSAPPNFVPRTKKPEVSGYEKCTE